MKSYSITLFLIIILCLCVNPSFASVQKTCPVMEGNLIKKEINLDYQGKKVFFCCLVCKQTFSENPEKYLSKLPQFSETDTPSVKDSHEHSHFSLGKLTVPLGISTLVLLFTTLSLGIFMKKNRRLIFPWHKRFAILTAISALLHVSTILFNHS